MAEELDEHVDPVTLLAREVSRVADLLELFFWRQGGATVADMRRAQQLEADGQLTGKTFVPTMTDEELADAEWRELHGRPQMEEPIPGGE